MTSLTGKQIAGEGLAGWAYFYDSLETRIATPDFASSDTDNLPSERRFSIGNLSGGHFAIVTDLDTAGTGCTQADIYSALVRFGADCSYRAPRLDVSVSDGTAASADKTFVAGS